MKARKLGILSLLTASLCCLGPVVLIALGLGGLGMGALLGKYHWYFIACAVVLLFAAWKGYFREKRACASDRCSMEGKKMTAYVLGLASAVVVAMAGLNVYTYAKDSPNLIASQKGTQISVSVRGMTCFTCEMAVQSALKRLPGILSVRASAKDATVLIAYDPAQTVLDEILEAMRDTGYEASIPAVQR